MERVKWMLAYVFTIDMWFEMPKAFGECIITEMKRSGIEVIYE